MNILIVSQYFWPEDFRINDVAKSLQQNGNNVDILTGNPNYPEGKVFAGYSSVGMRQENWEGLNVYRVPIITRGSGGAFRRIFNYLSFVITGSVLGPWLLRRKQYDVIFVYGVSPILQALPAIIIKLIKGSKLVVWVQDLWPESLEAMGFIRNKSVLALIGMVVRLIYKFTDLILIQSRAFEPNVRTLAPKNRILYFPNSVSDIFSLPPTGDAPEAVNSVTQFSVLFAGNVGIGQAVSVIADTAEILMEHTDIKFIVLGQGSKWQWLNEEKERRQLTNLKLLGRFPASTMPAFMQRASLLLVTLADEEIFAQTIPNKVQAYMAVGKPVIASINGEGARIINESGSGIAVPAENPNALAEAIIMLKKMEPAEREQMGNKARAYYLQNFEHNRLIADLEDFFEDLIQIS